MEVREPNGTYESGGHVAVVNAVRSNRNGTYSVQLVQQNASSVYLNGVTWDGSSITIPASSRWTYPIQGVLHAPSGNGAPTPALVQRADGESDVAAVVNGRLQFFWNVQGQPGWLSEVISVGPVTGTPALVQRPDGESDVAAVVNGRLQFFWNVQGQPGWSTEVISAG